MKKFLILLAVLIAVGCTSRKDAERALTSQGFTNIRVTGYDWFACSEDDFYHTGFIAVNTSGKEVTGTVCSGLFFKNATIRY